MVHLIKLKQNKLFSLIRKTRQLNLTFEVSVELFERLIIPILLYGSEIWGYEDPKQLQTTFNNIMRKFLRLHKTTPMCMINGELGLKEISEYIENRMINFWCNIATGEESKFSTIMYKWTKTLYDKNDKQIKDYKYKSLWIDKIKTILDKIEMSDLF